MQARRLTVREFIEQLQQEDMDAIIAFENNGYPNTIVQIEDCWQAGTFYMKREPRIQKEYLIEDEIPADKKSDYVKVLVLGAIATQEEVLKSGVTIAD